VISYAIKPLKTVRSGSVRFLYIFSIVIYAIGNKFMIA
jgi:hypothetical protein